MWGFIVGGRAAVRWGCREREAEAEAMLEAGAGRRVQAAALGGLCARGAQSGAFFHIRLPSTCNFVNAREQRRSRNKGGSDTGASSDTSKGVERPSAPSGGRGLRGGQ